MVAGEATGEDGKGGASVSEPQVGQRSNGTNAPHSISEGVCTAKNLERTEKDGELMVISTLAFVALPTAPSSLQGQRCNNPHSISEGGSTAKILETTNNPHSISEGRSSAKILKRTEKEGEVMIISPLAFAAVPTAPATLHGQHSNTPHSISKGGSAAKILEMTEKEGEVTIITKVAGKTSGMTEKEMYLPKLPDWPSREDKR
jgi:hypothetical protein